MLAGTARHGERSKQCQAYVEKAIVVWEGGRGACVSRVWEIEKMKSEEVVNKVQCSQARGRGHREAAVSRGRARRRRVSWEGRGGEVT